LLALALAICARQLVAASEKAYVRRGTPERQGDAWVERAICGTPARQGGRLVLRADLGSVTIKPGANDRVECEVILRAYGTDEARARRFFSDYALRARTLEGGSGYIGANLARDRRRSLRFSADFHISVPLRFNVDLESQGGDVNVERLEGQLRVVTAGGNIRTGDVSGPLSLETAGGSIILGNLGQRVEARTAGGGIYVGDVSGEAVLETSGGEIVAGYIRGPVRARTAAGDITLGGASGAVIAETAGGQIRIGDAEGAVRASTAGGAIQVQKARGMVQVETAGGSIDLFQVHGGGRAQTAAGSISAQISSDRHSFKPSVLQTSMGDVHVYLPPDLPLTIDAAIQNAAGHKILSDFSLDIRGGEGGFMVRSLRGRGELNGGGELLRVRTVAGNIEIRKLDARISEELKARQQAFWQSWQRRRLERSKRRLGPDEGSREPNNPEQRWRANEP